MKPDDGYIKYIANPKSGATSGKLVWNKFEKYLIKKGYDVRINLTKSLSHACELAAEAAEDSDCAMTIAIGGDGTIREVAHGLEGSNIPLLILPGGTENLLANELGFDGKLESIIKTFDAHYMRPLDLGNINGKCFTSIAGFGYDGEVVHRMSEQRSGHIDHYDYFWPIWRSFWNYKFDPINVTIDDQEVYSGPGLVFVGNISRYAIGLQILHDANYSDGLLDICIYKCGSQGHLVKHSIMTVLKHHSHCRDVIYKQGKKITITSETNRIKSEIDGDPGPDLPVEIKIIPNAVQCVVPEGAKPAGIRTRIKRAIG